MELKKVSGKVEKISLKNNAVQIDGIWYGNKYKPEVVCKIGDVVRVTYKTNGTFNNFEELEILSNFNPTPEKSQSSDIPLSMLLSYSKDLLVANINAGLQVEDMKKMMEECNEAIIHGKEDLKKRLDGAS